MFGKFRFLFSLVFTVSCGVCVFGENKDPNTAEVLRHYRESLSYLKSVSMKIDIELDVDENHPNKWFCPFERHFIFRRDHDRCEWVGQQLIFDEKGNVDPVRSQVIKEIINGELYANVISTPLNARPRGVVIKRDYNEERERLLEDSDYGGPLFGRMYGCSHKSIGDLLSESATLYMRPERENINGIPCYVLEATTKYGKVTAWIAPGKGYSALKWTMSHP